MKIAITLVIAVLAVSGYAAMNVGEKGVERVSAHTLKIQAAEKAALGE
jgi:hypothetical protein